MTESYCCTKRGNCSRFTDYRTSCIKLVRTDREKGNKWKPNCEHYRGNIPKEGVWIND